MLDSVTGEEHEAEEVQQKTRCHRTIIIEGKNETCDTVNDPCKNLAAGILEGSNAIIICIAHKSGLQAHWAALRLCDTSPRLHSYLASATVSVE